MLRRVPLLPVALALMAGIALQHHVQGVALPGWLALALGAALTAGVTLVLSRRMNVGVTLVLVSFSVAGMGGVLGRMADPKYDDSNWKRLCYKEQVFMKLRLTDTPRTHKKSLRTEADVLSVEGTEASGDIVLYLRLDSITADLRYGDQLLVHGYPNPYYGIIYLTSDHFIITHRDSTSFKARCEALRMRLLHRMQRGPLDKEVAGVAEALTLGWKGDIDYDTRAAYQDAGIAHLLAVSGLHVGLLAAMVGGCLFWVGRKPKGRAVKGTAQIVAVWTFALLTGMAASTVRASLMFSLFIASDIMGRRTPKLNLLALVAIVTLTVEPMLLYDVGWQLSYAAVAGILLAMPLIMLYRNWLWQAASMSVVATLSTLPVTLPVFHRLPLYFLVANVAVVPLAGVVLALSLLYMALPCDVTAWPLGVMLKGMRWLTEWVASLPGAVVETADTPAWFVALLALAVVAILLGIHYTMSPVGRRRR